MAAREKTLVEELASIRGKAEIVNGEIVQMSPTGGLSGYAADAIHVSLWSYAQQMGKGRAVADNKGFLVDLPKREAFSPDAAYWTGPNPGIDFYQGAPVFAVEVRSKNDYGPRAEREIAQKRADYFAAGTVVVWDVDLLHEDIVWVYRANDPDNPTVYRRGDTAEAEPAVPGWTITVDEMFPAEG